MAEVRIKTPDGNNHVGLATANLSGDVTLTLPKASLDLSTAGTDGQFLKTNGSGTLSFASSKILGYAKQTTSATTDCSAFSSFTTIGSFALSYTPVASTSKLFFTTQLNMTVRAVNGSYYGAADIQILHGSHATSEKVVLLRPPGSGTGTAHTWPVTICHEFDAVNTSSRDFEIQIHNDSATGGNNNGDIHINQYSGLSWMSVLEVSA